MLPKFDNSAVGKDIEAICSKCDVSWHVIVALETDGRIAQVQCKTCGAFHKYKPVTRDQMNSTKSTSSMIAFGVSPNDPAAPRKRSSEKSPKGAATKAPAAPKTLTPQVEYNGEEAKTYNIKTRSYKLGDKIIHSKYGVGIVDGLESHKMYVTFPTERVLLVFGK